MGFGGGSIEALGQIRLPISFGLGDFACMEDIMFDVLYTPYPYNAIFGRHLLNAFYTVPHHGFLCMKMPDPRGIIKVLGDQKASRLIDIGKALGQREVNALLFGSGVEEVTSAATRYIPKAKPGEGVKEVALREVRPDQKIRIAKTLPPELEGALLAVMR